MEYAFYLGCNQRLKSLALIVKKFVNRNIQINQFVIKIVDVGRNTVSRWTKQLLKRRRKMGNEREIHFA